ncbi:MAG: hypothetical protein E7366_01780 [Clostridiales bacterium]|nr:hypothetical protein [Clostridiales bacterium]
MRKDKKLYVVSHSHWDREWYLSHAKHNFNLVQFMDKLIEVLETDPEFKSFHLDGQIIVLEDYLKVRPSMENRVKKLIADGRIKVGPFYVLQDEYLISGESNVRNVLVGLKETAKYGDATMVGYFPDTFGNVGQMPQILNSFGMDCALVGRGTVPNGYEDEHLGKTDEGMSEFRWISPDGSEVFASQFTFWYSNGMELPEDKDALDERLGGLLYAMAPCANTDAILLLNGCDHQPVQANLSNVLAAAKELGYDIQHTTAEDYMAVLRPYKDNFPIWNGEICQENSKGVRTLRETASARIYLKQQNYRANYLLESVAEPMAAIVDGYGLRYDGEMLHYLWKGLLENYPHDSICGCSVDEVHTKMEMRFAETLDTAQSYIDQMGRRLVAKIAGTEKSVVVVNCYPQTVSDYVECIVDYKEGEEIPQNPILIDKDGKEYSVVVTDFGEQTIYELPEDKFRQIYKVRRFSYRIYGEFAPACCTVLTVKSSKKTEITKVSFDENSMENEYVRVSFNKNGTFNITDKASGKVLEGQNAFVEIGDEGNEYEFFPKGEQHDTLQDEGDISIQSAESDKVTFRVINHLLQQNGEYVEIESQVSLLASKKDVQVSVRFENTCKDHRIRADFTWDHAYPTHNSAGHFDITNRVNKPWDKWVAPYHPQRTFEFVERLSDEGVGSILAVRGNHEYEVDMTTGHTQLTLVRGVGILGDWFDFYTYDSQCLRTVTAEYAVEFYTSENRAEAVASAYAFNRPRLYAFAGNGKGEAARSSVVSVKGDVVASCLKQSDAGETVLRIFNPYNEARKVKFDREVQLTDMRETLCGEKVTELTLAEKKIITIKF